MRKTLRFRPAVGTTFGAARGMNRARESSCVPACLKCPSMFERDRKSTRLNSSHITISYASFCLKKKTNQIKQLIRNGRSASLQRTFKKSFTSFSHSTRNKTRDGLIRVRNIRALNGRFNTSITHAYSIVIGSKLFFFNDTATTEIYTFPYTTLFR